MLSHKVPSSDQFCLLIFINDLPNASAMSTILLADDATLSSSHHSYEVLVDRVNSELTGIAEWMKCNKLTVNIDKTYCIIFINRQINPDVNMPLVLDGSGIETVQSGKYFGCHPVQPLEF